MKRTTIEPGKHYFIRMPYSDVCMHMDVAGKILLTRLMLTDTYGRGIAYLYREDGDMFCAPILASEAGILHDMRGYYSTDVSTHE